MFIDPESALEPGSGAGFEREVVRPEDLRADGHGWYVDDVLEDPGAEVDALDELIGSANLLAVFAADRFVRVDRVRTDALMAAKRPGGPGADIVLRSVRLEIAAALRITEHAAEGLLGRAEVLVHRHPAVLASLSAAGMTERHAEIIVDTVGAVEREFQDDVVSRAIVLAEDLPVGSFRRALRRLVDTVRVETLEERHRAAVEQRRVILEPSDDGMAWLSIHVPAVEAQAIYTRVTAMGKVITAVDGETRSLDQVRADVVCDLLIDGIVSNHPDETRGIRATVAVTVPALTLLTGDTSEGPAVVEGVGPIPVAKARELCGGDAGWMRVLTHPETGMVLSVGRDLYRPPPALRRLVKWRAGRCMAPGCGVSASRCEIDHQVAWEHGGHTSVSNTTPFCTGHHTVKHHGGWRVTQLPESGGVIEWVSPLGRVYRVVPERPIPVFRPDSDSPPPF